MAWYSSPAVSGYSFTPTSPRVPHYSSYGVGVGASSPRADAIGSVTQRVEYLQRTGRLHAIMHAATQCSYQTAQPPATGAASTVPEGGSGRRGGVNEPFGSSASASALGAATAASSSIATAVATPARVMPTYDEMALASSVGAARTSSKAALIAIDRHLLRRYVFGVLDSDMIVRGVVVNKHANLGLIIAIAEILWPIEKPREVLAKQHHAAQQLLAQMQQSHPDAAISAREKSGARPSSLHCFPPLSTFLGGINSQAATSSTSGPSLSSTTSDLDSAYQVERALFANFEVLGIHGECHLGEMHAPMTPVKASPDGTGAGAPLAAVATASLERFSLGDQVKALVISVDTHSEKMYLSMNQNRLRGQLATMHRLGVIRDEPPATTASGLTDPTAASSILSKLKPDLQERISAYAAPGTPVHPSIGGGGGGGLMPPATPTLSHTNSTMYGASFSQYLKGSTTPTHPSASPYHPTSSSLASPHPLLKARVGGGGPRVPPSLALLGNPALIAKARNYLQYLHSTALFKNPEGVNKLTACYHVNEYGLLTQRSGVHRRDLYKQLRHAQNQSWAKESVMKGIALAKIGSYANAMKCYKHALDIEPHFTQAYVARGAAYVLQGMLPKAIDEFERALQIDPQQPYALTYLQAAKDKLAGRTTSTAPVAPVVAASAAPAAAAFATPPASFKTIDLTHRSRDDEEDDRHRRRRRRRDSSDSPTPRSSSTSKKKKKKHKKHKKHKKSRRSRANEIDAFSTAAPVDVVDLAQSDCSDSSRSPSVSPPAPPATTAIPTLDALIQQPEGVQAMFDEEPEARKTRRTRYRDSPVKQHQDQHRSDRRRRSTSSSSDRSRSSSASIRMVDPTAADAETVDVGNDDGGDATPVSSRSPTSEPEPEPDDDLSAEPWLGEPHEVIVGANESIEEAAPDDGMIGQSTHLDPLHTDSGAVDPNADESMESYDPNGIDVESGLVTGANDDTGAAAATPAPFEPSSSAWPVSFVGSAAASFSDFAEWSRNTMESELEEEQANEQQMHAFAADAPQEHEQPAEANEA